MSEPTVRTFVDRCVAGEALPGDIDEAVAQWHESDSNESLTTFLGLRDDEYAAWVEVPSTLGRVVEARRRALRA